MRPRRIMMQRLRSCGKYFSKQTSSAAAEKHLFKAYLSASLVWAGNGLSVWDGPLVVDLKFRGCGGGGPCCDPGAPPDNTVSPFK